MIQKFSIDMKELNRTREITVYPPDDYYSSHDRYPVLYTGKTLVDWKTLKKIPKFNILASNMGISFLSHDLGGTIFRAWGRFFV